MSSNFYQQSEVAAALMRLAARIAAYAATHRAHILELRYAAEDTGRDFPTLVVARVLGVDYSEITDLERWAAKEGLFVYLYAQPGDQVTRIQDSIIIERGSAR